ncbi:MAG: bifunctional nuclease family protein, partial [candidate division KSB1 bacterium]|nr:bifunctional nuclease family protein [candidate division KSB1 bacterium]
MLVSVRVDRVTLDTSTNRFVVILKDDVNHRWLPIVVGHTEAQAIALQLEKIIPPRPMTHDLMKNLLESIDAQISRVIVSDLRENTYYALIGLKCNGNHREIDARPSDAIALALRMQAPIFVAEKVMKRAAVKERTQEREEPLTEIDKLEELNIQLQKAIKEERFEDAARKIG